MADYIQSFALILGGLLAGMATRWASSRTPARPERVDQLVRIVQRAMVTVFVPITTGLAVWVADLQNPQYAALPLWGLLSMLGALALAWLVAAWRGGNGKRRAALFASSGFGNVGSVGSLVIFLVLGEGALAYQPLLYLLEKPLIFAVGFPIVRGWAQGDGQRLQWRAFLTAWRDPALITTVLAAATGLALNLAGVARPEALGWVNKVLMPLSTAMLLWSLGMNLRVGRLGGHGRAVWLGAAVRLLLAPAWALALFALVPLPGLAARVAVLLAASPPAFLSQVAVQLYGADRDEASAIFLSGMGLYGLTMPLWLWLTGVLFGG